MGEDPDPINEADNLSREELDEYNRHFIRCEGMGEDSENDSIEDDAVEWKYYGSSTDEWSAGNDSS